VPVKKGLRHRPGSTSTRRFRCRPAAAGDAVGRERGGNAGCSAAGDGRTPRFPML